uniref:Uncharacterized protein n=1 Tax=Colobus angolensis palliatus TaxID=336983 RepID=A0A2K5I5Y6_COLAP
LVLHAPKAPKLLCPSHGCQTLIPPHWVLGREDPRGYRLQEPRREDRPACGTPGCFGRSEGTVNPLFFKGSWRLLTLSSLASRDFIFTG